MTPRCRATSSCDNPSRWRSTTGARSFSGNRPNSSSGAAWSAVRSAGGGDAGATGSGAAAAGLASRAIRRAVCAAAFLATRVATSNSHPPMLSRQRTWPALRASTRKHAWNASSAACASRRCRRQTASTIGPCRAIRSANALSERSMRNRSINSRSVACPPGDTTASFINWRTADGSVRELVMVLIPNRGRGIVPHPDMPGSRPRAREFRGQRVLHGVNVPHRLGHDRAN